MPFFRYLACRAVEKGIIQILVAIDKPLDHGINSWYYHPRVRSYPVYCLLKKNAWMYHTLYTTEPGHIPLLPITPHMWADIHVKRYFLEILNFTQRLHNLHKSGKSSTHLTHTCKYLLVHSIYEESVK